MSTHTAILEALMKVLRTKFEVLQDAEIIVGSSLKFRPDALFISPDGTLFVVEVKTPEVSLDHIRVLIDFCSDLQSVLGPSLEVLLASPKELKPTVSKYIDKISSIQPFRFHFVHLPIEKALHITSLNESSPGFRQESTKVLDLIV
jgi:hypothetical protein